MSTVPKSIRIRMYNVGFGDCFLLTFRYASGDRHVLIDYGSNARGAGLALDDLGPRIAADCGGKLMAIVLSHRHRDHIRGFDPTVGGGAIKPLAPEMVLRPWTEAPDAAEPGAHGPAIAPESLRRSQFVRALDAGQDAAERLATVGAGDGTGSRLRAAVTGLAALELKNAAAVHLLHELSEGNRGTYLSAGMPLDVEPILPGVRISVLGPPLPDQWPAITKERSDDPEYWLRLASTLPDALGTADLAADLPPGPEAWLAARLQAEGLHSAMRIVLSLDAAMNNTSLILLIEAAGRRLLFPGDAQIENWSYTLSGPGATPAILDALAKIDVYKVGHHGSRNATPKKSLLPLWTSLAAGTPISMMSTLLGPYDDSNPVPSQPLVNALSVSPTALIRSDQIPGGKPFADLDIPGR